MVVWWDGGVMECDGVWCDGMVECDGMVMFITTIVVIDGLITDHKQ